MRAMQLGQPTVQAAHRVVYSPGYGRLISAGRDGLTLVWDPR